MISLSGGESSWRKRLLLLQITGFIIGPDEKSRQIGNKPLIPYILYEVTAPCTQSGNAKPCCILLVRLGVSPNGSHNQINILSGDNINGVLSSSVGAAF